MRFKYFRQTEPLYLIFLYFLSFPGLTADDDISGLMKLMTSRYEVIYQKNIFITIGSKALTLLMLLWRMILINKCVRPQVDIKLTHLTMPCRFWRSILVIGLSAEPIQCEVKWSRLRIQIANAWVVRNSNICKLVGQQPRRRHRRVGLLRRRLQPLRWPLVVHVSCLSTMSGR